jgi:hypothetical protein
MLNHATLAACSTLRFPNSPEKVAGHIWTVNYGCNVTPIAEDVRSLLILPESSIAYDPSCNFLVTMQLFAAVVDHEEDDHDNVFVVENAVHLLTVLFLKVISVCC